MADIEPLKKDFFLSEKEYRDMPFGIVLGVSLSSAVMDGIEDSPTLLYKWHYRQANNLLDKIAFQISGQIMEMNYRALPIPASQLIDWDRQLGAVSHRTVGEYAGLGWRGRNNLLVNPEYGARIRLVTVLTDLPLVVDKPIENGCGDCRACLEVCPAEALGETAKEYNLEKCYQKLTEFSKIRGVGVHICGICVKACKGQGKTP